MLKYLCAIALSLLNLSARNTMYPSIGQDPSCNRIYSGRNDGTFGSPGNLDFYGVHRMCNYLITVASGGQIDLTFTDVEMTGAADLPLNYIVVFDGPDCLSRRIGVVFARETPTFVSTNSKMTALFISNRQAVSEKFEAKYTRVTGQETTELDVPSDDNRMLRNCGNETGGPSGTLSFSGRGWRNALCIWRIEVEFGRKVHVHFTDLKLNPALAWLRILDGDHCGAPVKALINNTDGFASFNISSSSNKMTIIFFSAYGTEAAELMAYYTDGSTSEVTASSPGPTSSEVLLIGSENVANNLAPTNTFSLLSNYLAYIIAGMILILLKIIAHFEMPILAA